MEKNKLKQMPYCFQNNWLTLIIQNFVLKMFFLDLNNVK